MAVEVEQSNYKNALSRFTKAAMWMTLGHHFLGDILSRLITQPTCVGKKPRGVSTIP
jgi:hypothetical protein